MASLKTRLSWGLMLSLIALLTLQWLIVMYAISRLTENQLIDRLQRECENLLTIVSFNSSDQLQIDAQRMGAIYQRPFSGHYYTVFTSKQSSISRSLWDSELSLQSLAAGQERKLRLNGPNGQSLLVVLRGYKKQKHTVTVAVAENVEPLQANIHRFQLLYALISVVGLLVLLGVQRLMVLNALKPLKNIQVNIDKLGRGETSLLELEGPDEIRPLIDAINRLLTGMDRKYHRSRESLGNLAHALKTRLSLVNQIAEHPIINHNPDIQSSIYESTTVMSNIIERELKRARLLGDVRPGRQVDLKVGIAELINTLRQIYASKGVNITSEVALNAQFFGDKEDLMEMLGNLLDNACKWSRNRVSLTVMDGEGISFIIEDDGDGASAVDLNMLTRRGFRADESQPGSGLGLAIVNDIVESYNGTLNFSRSAAMGGLRVEIKLDQFKEKTT
ncbi:MAG: sensor histidine kinase [Methylotenera sp.]|nr:sensor histidine kinase [Methylotenera sp.]